MSILSKIFGKKDDGGRVSSVERYEASVERPLEFLTKVGGSRPLDFLMKTEKASEMQTEPLELLRQAIESGCIDKDSDLTVFYDMVEQLGIQRENEFKKQAISRKEVGHEIIIGARQELLIRRRKQSQLSGERSMLSGIDQYKEFSLEKGLGD